MFGDPFEGGGYGAYPGVFQIECIPIEEKGKITNTEKQDAQNDRTNCQVPSHITRGEIPSPPIVAAEPGRENRDAEIR